MSSNLLRHHQLTGIQATLPRDDVGCRHGRLSNRIARVPGGRNTECDPALNNAVPDAQEDEEDNRAVVTQVETIVVKVSYMMPPRDQSN